MDTSTEAATPSKRWRQVLVLAVILLDVGITVVGVTEGWGREVNPLFAWFTERGPLWMVGAGVGYQLLVASLYRLVRDRVAAVLTALLLPAHTVGVLSWLRIGVLSRLDPPLDELWIVATTTVPL
ncbi:MAG: DUF5658 family protein [Natrialbaceae archaeon]